MSDTLLGEWHKTRSEYDIAPLSESQLAGAGIGHDLCRGSVLDAETCALCVAVAPERIGQVSEKDA